jgi:twitching motility protein PilT
MSVRPIDRFIGAMHRDRADELLLETGRPVRLRVAGNERVLLAQEVRTDQVESLIKDVIPPDVRRNFDDGREVSFAYSAPSGTVNILLTRSGDRLSAIIRLFSPKKPAAPEPFVVESPLDSIGATTNTSTHRIQGKPAPVQGSPIQGIPIQGSPIQGSPIQGIPIQGSPIQGSPIQGNLVPGATGRRGAATARAPRFDTPTPAVTPAVTPVPMKDASMDLLRGDGPMELEMSGDLEPMARAKPAVAPAPVRAPALAKVPPPSTPLAKVPPPLEPPSVVPVAPERSGPPKIDRILWVLVGEKGSDLHITAGLPPRMRKDGDIRSVPGFDQPLESAVLEEWLMEIAPPKMAEKFKTTNDTDFGYEIQGLARFRVNVFRDRRGVGGVLRVIPSQILSADALKLPQVVRDLCGLAKGLVVVTGPTGSGKSTTLAAMLDLINRSRADHVITIEDPVEFVHEPIRCLINQREVHAHTQSFSAALRAALREDPDIVLVGEMRDLETVSIAIETAETGHLVFGTLHTNTAVSTVDRIIDQFPADRQAQVRVMLSESLKGVIAQTLCKKIGGGRVAALEILVGVPAIANMIREAKTFQIPSIMQTGKQLGMQTLNDSLFQLVKDSVVDAKEAYMKSVARADMRAMLEKANFRVD